MWRDVRFWSQRGKEAVHVVSRNQLLQYFHGFWHFGTVVLELNVVEVQVVHVPVSFISSKAAQSVFCQVVFVRVGRRSIRLKS